MMVKVLYPVVFGEMGLILILSFKSPLRRLMIRALDLTKHGRGPIVVQTLSVTLLLVFIASLQGLSSVRTRLLDAGGAATPTDQVLVAYHLLEASLLGFSLFLGLIVDRLHYYLRDVQTLRNKVDDCEQRLRKAKTRNMESVEKNAKDHKAKTRNMESVEKNAKDHKAKTRNMESVEKNDEGAD